MRNFLLFTFLILSANAHALTIVASEFPPYQFEKNGAVEGLATEIVKEVLAGAHEEGVTHIYPWPRAYKMAQKGPDILIYSINRTPEREKLFKWIGSIAPFEVYFWKLSSRKDIKIKHLKDSKDYISGAVFDDAKGAYLQTIGFTPGRNLEFVGSEELNIRKLFVGRIDIMPYEHLNFPRRVEALGYDSKKLVKLIKLDGMNQELYLAASLGTSDALVMKLSRSLEEFKKTKKYKEIRAKFR